MKFSKVCPKCGGTDLRPRELSIGASALDRSSYQFEAFICTNCKYTEFYLKFAGV